MGNIIRDAARAEQGLLREYIIDPSMCSKCGGDMRIIAFIEDYKVIKKILDYLGIYEFGRDRPPPKRLAVADSFDDYIDCNYLDF